MTAPCQSIVKIISQSNSEIGCSLIKQWDYMSVSEREGWEEADWNRDGNGELSERKTRVTERRWKKEIEIEGCMRGQWWLMCADSQAGLDGVAGASCARPSTRPPLPRLFTHLLNKFICAWASIGYGCQVMRKTGLRNCWPSQAVHLHPSPSPPPSRSPTHICRDKHAQASAHIFQQCTRALATNRANSVSKCVNKGFSSKISSWTEI